MKAQKIKKQVTILQEGLAKIRITFLALTCLVLCSCHYQNQNIRINPNPQEFTIEKYYNKKLNIEVIDKRENKEILGIRTPINIWDFEEDKKISDISSGYNADNLYKIAYLENKQNLAKIFEDKLVENLTKRGLKIKRFTTNQIKIEILEIRYFANMYRHMAKVSVKVIAKNRDTDLVKIYTEKEISKAPAIKALLFGPFNPGTSKLQNEEIINNAIDKTIKNIINDNKIWNFLD